MTTKEHVNDGHYHDRKTVSPQVVKMGQGYDRM